MVLNHNLLILLYHQWLLLKGIFENVGRSQNSKDHENMQKTSTS